VIDPLSATVGATGAIALREFVEYRFRRAKKIADCYHDFYETNMDGYITRHCKKCPYQESGGRRDSTKH
jgi:hypothetical protein